MMRVGLMAAVAAAGMAVVATPAEAGWRFTEWGMTADEVVAASDGTVIPRDPEAIAESLALKQRIVAAGAVPSPDLCTLKLREPLIIADMEFTDIEFCFSPEGRLTGVVTRTGTSAQQVSDALAQAFGPPVSVVRGEFPSWTFVDRNQGNALRLAPRSAGGASIVYDKLATGF